MEVSSQRSVAAHARQGLLIALAGVAAWLGMASWSLMRGAGLATQWADAGHWLSLDLEAFWFPLLANLALLLLVAFFARALLRLPWGRDLTWTGQGWQATDAVTALSVYAAAVGPPLTEAPGRVRAVAIVSVPSLMLLSSFAYSLLTVLFGEQPGLYAWLLLLLPCAGVLVHLLATWLQLKTRQVQVSAGGLVDSSFFCTLRVPWSGIGGMQRFGRDAGLHENFLSGRSGRQRPAERKMWIVMGIQPGQEILRLGDDMVPAQALVDLRARLGAGQHAPAAVPQKLEPAVQALRTARADAADSLLAHRQAFEQQPGRQSTHSAAMVLGLVLLLAPFVLGSLYMCYRSLWFQHVATRTEGTVVEVMADSLPSLRVAYRTAQGELLFTESDGSDAYAGIAVGDPVTVFYDPDDPQIVRLDFFLEHWLLPMLFGGLTLILLVVAIVITRSLRPRSGAP